MIFQNPAQYSKMLKISIFDTLFTTFAQAFIHTTQYQLTFWKRAEKNFTFFRKKKTLNHLFRCPLIPITASINQSHHASAETSLEGSASIARSVQYCHQQSIAPWTTTPTAIHGENMNERKSEKARFFHYSSFTPALQKEKKRKKTFHGRQIIA